MMDASEFNRIKHLIEAYQRVDWENHEAKDAAARAVYVALGRRQEQLFQLCKFGPIWDGDIISKSARDELKRLGLASSALNKGEDGFAVATYLGAAMLRAGTGHSGNFKTLTDFKVIANV